MSWFSGPAVPAAEFDAKIQTATSEAIPNGEIDIAVALEITDLVRSKQVPPKQAMRALKKRLGAVCANPNLVTSTLKLCDLCVKNCGMHFLVEIALPEFIDYLANYVFAVHYNTREQRVYTLEAKLHVGNFILQLIKEWSIYFTGQPQLENVTKVYHLLEAQGYEFPPVDPSIVLGTLVDSLAPPDWVDSDECMQCYTRFTVISRKHHCRSCGGAFCQTHLSHESPLVHLGIMEPVRVCDYCYELIQQKKGSRTRPKHRRGASGDVQQPLEALGTGDEDDQLRKAIELSLRELGQVPEAPKLESAPPSTENADEDDGEMRQAIAASLKEFEEHEKRYDRQPEPQQALQPQPQNDFYSNMLPQMSSDQPSAPFASQHAPFSSGPQHFTGQSQRSSGANPQDSLPPFVQSPAPVLDLSSQEEDSINLFITIINSIKSDASKQNNIVHDKELTNLYNNVVQLKPKLNKSLRVAIERYELYLELNNKVSTITRLYDQFLEAKLSQAYGHHHVSQPQQPQSTGGGYAPYPVSFPSTRPEQNVPNQLYYQLQGQQPPAQREEAPRPLAPLAPSAQGQPNQPFTQPQAPSEPAYTGNQYAQCPEKEQEPLQQACYESYLLPYPVQERIELPQEQTFSTGSQAYNSLAFAQPSYPQEPSYPELDNSDAESVASRYPALKGESPELEPQLPNSHQQHPSVRYPPIEQVESSYGQRESNKSSGVSKPFTAEPEPLIDL